MIKSLKHNEIDKRAWDECISKSDYPLVYALSWYLDVVSPNWNGLILNDYQAVMPITHKRKCRIRYLSQPFYCQKTGVFGNNLTTDTINLFISKARSMYKFIEISIYNSVGSPLVDNIEQRANYTLSLNESYEVLKSRFSGNTIRNIQKSEQRRVFYKEHINPEDIVNLKRSVQKHIPQAAITTLSKLLASFQKHNIGKTIGVFSKDGEMIAAAYMVCYANRAIYFTAVSNDIGKEQRAMFFLINEYIKLNAGKNITLDFEGSMISGIARFYESFGAMNEPYFLWKENNLPFPIKFLKR